MFAYCGNNPANHTDEHGYFAITWKAFIKGFISGFTRAAATAVTNGSLGEIAIEFVVGFAEGMLSDAYNLVNIVVKVYDAIMTYGDFKKSGASNLEALSAALLSGVSDYLYDKYSIENFKELMALTFDFGYSLTTDVSKELWKSSIESNQIEFIPSNSHRNSINNSTGKAYGGGGNVSICNIAFSY